MKVWVVEGSKKRLQAFEGVVIAIRNRGLHSAFTVRKISNGEGVERVFQTHSPVVDSITAEEVYIDEMVGRINANMILPYPPGVPLVMPGEMITEESRPVLEFLQMLCEIGAHYPGFETDTTKRTRWMPWQSEAMKDVLICEKRR